MYLYFYNVSFNLFIEKESLESKEQFRRSIYIVDTVLRILNTGDNIDRLNASLHKQFLAILFRSIHICQISFSDFYK